jgi:hypothetical protein
MGCFKAAGASFIVGRVLGEAVACGVQQPHPFEDSGLAGAPQLCQTRGYSGDNAKVGEALLVGGLDFGGKQNHRNVGGFGQGAQLAEGCGAIHARHHHVKKDGIGTVFPSLGYSSGAGSGDQNIPPGHGFEAQRSDLANILLVVDDENAS